MPEMKLPPSAKPSKACDDTQTRPALSHGIVLEEDGKRILITTDAFILCRHQVADDIPTGLIHPEALEQIEIQTPHEIEDGHVTANGGSVTTTWKPYAEGKVPFADKLAPTYEPTNRVVTVAINPELLLRLAQALGHIGRGVVLEIPVKNSTCQQAIRVTTYDDNGAEGLLMPIKVDRKKRADSRA